MSASRLLIGVAIALLAVLSYRLWFANDGVQEIWRLEKEIEIQQQEVSAKQQRNRELQAEVKDLKDGVDAVEERARNELGMTGKGETFVQIVDGEKTPP